jgi:hypothetical protein
MKKTGYWGISKLEKLEEDDNFKKIIGITKKKKRTIFDIIDKKRDELIFSSVLKYFLDPKEDHKLQDYFLHRFLHLLINNNRKNLNKRKANREILDSSNLCKANVFIEYSIGEDGRLDIFIELPNKLACVVEVKLFSYEGNEQTLRYKKWTEKNFSNKYELILLCYLTPDGQKAESDFISISFEKIISIFNPEKIKSKSNKDYQFLLENFYEWIKELKPMDKKTKKYCMELYKKYKAEINMILENSPKVLFMRDTHEYIKNTNSNFEVHYSKNWLNLFPGNWLKNENEKYSKVRVEYTFLKHDKLHMSLVIPNNEKYIDIIKKHSNKIFNKSYDNIGSFNYYQEIYLYLHKYESFVPEDNIDNWEEIIIDYSVKIVDCMKNVQSIIEKDIINL